MPMTTQEALNQMSQLNAKGDEISDEEKKKLAELKKYLQGNAPGASGLGNAKSQMEELEY